MPLAPKNDCVENNGQHAVKHKKYAKQPLACAGLQLYVLSTDRYVDEHKFSPSLRKNPSSTGPSVKAIPEEEEE